MLIYWLEKGLSEKGIHMTDIPPELFKLLPPMEFLRYCHCNLLVRYPGRRKNVPYCTECECTTWRFSELGKQSGFDQRKVVDLTSQEIETLPCNFFERCDCESEEPPAEPRRSEAFQDFLNQLREQMPRLGFSF
ncbi:MAG: hypothetical protein COV74_00320 [Candidatus Omnitrophica bacterium CG11_big_fil_rev_8_21_14_0_20_45_26]|uniref:Uncharacterized protein n=1 Tax=Candidatus Abzuiibacterium crystallinum TaxID=1974748 RepID=A0A2H0LT64_9BACT|nr:MAG: hypothetical protein COV74_00320 [Candidatus Omnitrophica bacterium CG11_big_fil_rev_8_21_14_0_20_45_26]PIW64617.1 MAG: hypothetical protein COW12_05460 [Candidatus Omnitrophica bacterium CG12_big_fil_rev_8_21_14_0_65_45_16]